MNRFPSISPFKLLQPYHEGDIRIFFGREKETRQFAEAIMRSKFMLLYGASGTGKTSLIQCGLHGMFSPRDWLPILVRRGANFMDSLRERILEECRIRHKILSPEEHLLLPADIPLRDAINTLFNIAYVPVYLILEQFEEIFTLGDEAEQKAFFTLLEDLHLFDEDMFCKLVIVTREEYIAHFYRYEKELPFLFEHRFRVEKMREEQLLQVVDGMLITAYAGYPEFKIEEGTDLQILNNLTDERGEVDLTTLQVYLDRLYHEDLTRLSGTSRNHIYFDADLVGRNKLKNVLSDFLDRQVATVAAGLPQDLRSQHIPLQILFKLVTNQGTKQNRSFNEIKEELSKGRFPVSDDQMTYCLDRFSSTDSRILNRLRFAKTSEERFEVVHDHLAEQIFGKFNADEIRQREAQTTIQNKKKRWDEASGMLKKQKQEFLSIGEVELIDQSLNLERLDSDLKAFFENSRNYHQKRRVRQRWVTIISLVAALVFAAVALFAYWQRQVAENQRQLATRQKLVAQSAKLSAQSYISRSNDNIELANLLAAEAALINDNPQSEKALEEALNASPHLLHTIYTNDKIASIAISRNRQFIASGSYDSTVQLWDVQTGKARTEPRPGHDGIVYSIAISPDGHYVASGDANGKMIIWDLIANKEDSVKAHSGEIWGLSFSPDGRHIYTGANDEKLYVWDTQTGVKVDSLLNGEHGIIWCMATSPDGRYLAAGLNDYTICVWDIQTSKLVGKPIKGHTGYVSAIGFSLDGQKIVSGSDDKTVRVWDVNTGKQIGQTCKGHTETLWGVAFCKNGRQVVSAANDKKVRIWDYEAGQPIGQDLKGHQAAVLCMSSSLDRMIIATGANDKSIRVWDVNFTGQKREAFFGHDKTVYNAKFSPDGQRIISSSEDRTLRLLDTTGQLIKVMNGHTENVWGIAFSRDGRYAASGSFDLSIRLWDAKTGAPIRVFEDKTHDWIREVTFSPDGRYLAGACSDGSVWIWDVSTGKKRRTLKGHGSSVICVAFSPDGKKLASGSYDKTIRLWDVEHDTAIGNPFYGHEDYVWSVAFSPDGKTIVSGSSDQTIRFWDSETGHQIGKPVRGALSQIYSVSYSPDGRQIVSGSGDQTVRVWDTAKRVQIGKPYWGHLGAVRSVSFSNDGQTILSASEDKTVRLWHFDKNQKVPSPPTIQDLVQKAKELANRSLTPEEIKQYVEDDISN